MCYSIICGKKIVFCYVPIVQLLVFFGCFDYSRFLLDHKIVGWSAKNGSVRTAFAPNFPINRWRQPKSAHFRSRSKRLRIVRSSPLPLQKRLRLRKSELNKKAPLRRGRGISQQIPTPAPKIEPTVWPFQRAGGNKSYCWGLDIITLQKVSAHHLVLPKHRYSKGIVFLQTWVSRAILKHSGNMSAFNKYVIKGLIITLIVF
jgi:hypothetical protein